MDTLSLRTQSLIGAITEVTRTIGNFGQTARYARNDLDPVSRELVSTKTLLERLSKELQAGSVPENFGEQIININISLNNVLDNLDKSIKNHERNRLDIVRWGLSGKNEMRRFRTIIQSYKASLDIALNVLLMSRIQETQIYTPVNQSNSPDILRTTEQIIAEIDRLRNQFSSGEANIAQSNIYLSRYLDELTEYAETVVDESSDRADSVTAWVDETDEDHPAQVHESTLRTNAVTLRELQHEVAERTLALQSLQQDYDSLLQNLERMQKEPTTIESDFERSYTENITEEKERLQEQVKTLEQQLAETQKSRDEARRMGEERASQYLKIVEMAGRLQVEIAANQTIWENRASSDDRPSALPQLPVHQLQVLPRGNESTDEISRDSEAENGHPEGPKEFTAGPHPSVDDPTVMETESVLSRTSTHTFFTAATHPT